MAEAILQIYVQYLCIKKFRKWFGEEVIEKCNSERRDVPPNITQLPCGCTADSQHGATWTIESEPLESFMVFRTSRVMIHVGCGKSIGEIATPWAVF